MQELGPFGIRGLIIDFLAGTAAYNQAAAFQLAQVMGTGRTCHFLQRSQVDDTFLTVAEKPENPDAAAVAHLLENIGNHLKILYAGHVVKLMLQGLIVVVG